MAMSSRRSREIRNERPKGYPGAHVGIHDGLVSCAWMKQLSNISTSAWQQVARIEPKTDLLAAQHASNELTGLPACHWLNEYKAVFNHGITTVC